MQNFGTELWVAIVSALCVCINGVPQRRPWYAQGGFPQIQFPYNQGYLVTQAPTTYQTYTVPTRTVPYFTTVYQTRLPIPVGTTQFPNRNNHNQNQGSSNSAQESGQQFFEELSNLARDLQREMEPVRSQYSSLWARFFQTVKNYGNVMYNKVQSVADEAELENALAAQQKGSNQQFNLQDIFGTSAQEFICKSMESIVLLDDSGSSKDLRVARAFSEANLVPSFLPRSPDNLAVIEFPDGTKVNLGNEIAPLKTREAPSVVSWPTDPGSLYTLIMTDPHLDGSGGEWNHWLVVNIPGTDLRRGDTLTEYVPSGPPPKSGQHRYTFLVYKQAAKIVDQEHGYVNNRTPAGRGEFHTTAFAIKHNLGMPVAGNFYLAECDEYVNVVYAQLGLASPGPC